MDASVAGDAMRSVSGLCVVSAIIRIWMRWYLGEWNDGDRRRIKYGSKCL